jgi:hypothetical protein
VFRNDKARKGAKSGNPHRPPECAGGGSLHVLIRALTLGVAAFFLGARKLLANPLDDAMGVGGDVLDAGLLRDTGWQQITNGPEMLEFLLAVILAAVLTAAIAFHPVVMAERRDRYDFEEPRSLFLYALIGLLVGFMVMHHGYLIGFVIFGIGGLMRFKTDTGDLADTRRLILVTLIGLSVGLNLPVMAVIATACAFAVILVLGRKVHVCIEVQFESMKLARLHIDTLRDLLRERGYTVLSATKHRFKAGADYLIVVPGKAGRDALLREFTLINATKLHGISDWHAE